MSLLDKLDALGIFVEAQVVLQKVQDIPVQGLRFGG